MGVVFTMALVLFAPILLPIVLLVSPLAFLEYLALIPAAVFALLGGLLASTGDAFITWFQSISHGGFESIMQALSQFLPF